MPVPLRAVHHRGEAKHNVTTDFPSLGLHSAASTGNVGLVEYALSRGQPVNSVVDGVLPLHAACAGGNVQVVKLLIEYGADVNAPRLSKRHSSRDASAPIIGTTGSTPLHFAAANGNRDAIMLLLLHGAHANRADKHGVTPENLARQSGWIECADLLKEWILNKDKDLREREEFVAAEDKDSVKHRNRLGSFGDEPASFTSRHRLHVKHSIDTALNMLKSSSSNLSELYRCPHTPTPPTSPTKPLGDFASQLASFNGERSSSRRPSLPHIGHPDAPSRPSNSSVQLANPHQSNSAGEDSEEINSSQNKAGSARKIGSKVSLLNLFRKAQNSDGSSTPDLNTSTNSVVNDLTPLSTSPSGPAFRRSRPHQGSDASSRSKLVGDFSTERKTSLNSPARSPVPMTTDLNSNQPTLGQPNRDRSRSNASSQYNDDPITSSSYHSPGTSPLARLGMFRNQGHHRTRSGSGSSSGYDVTVPSRLGAASTVVVDDVQINRGTNNADVEGLSRSLPRAGIFKPHNRNGSNGQGHMTPSALRAISRDTSSHSQSPRGHSARLKSSNSSNSLVRSDSYSRRRTSLRPGSAGSGSKLNIEEEGEEEYGQPIEPTKTSLLIGAGEVLSRAALSPVMSNDHADGEQVDDFPFSINGPPPLPTDGDIDFISSPPTHRVADNRGRGDSLSSTDSQGLTQSPTNVTTALMITPPRLASEATPQSDKRLEALGSGAGLMDGEDEGVTDAIPKLLLRRSTPLSAGRSSNQTDSNRDSTSTLVLPSPAHLSNGSMNGRRTHTPFEIDLSSISTHAQAEALVERTRNQVMELASAEDYDGISTAGSDGRTPLSARLAAYGESLALERKFREQENGVTNATNNTTAGATLANGKKSGVSSRTSLLLPITSQHSREGSGYSSSLYSGKSAIGIKETPSRRSVDDVWNSLHGRRPSTAEGLASREVNLSRSSEQSDWPPPSMRSVSAMGHRRTEASVGEQNSIPTLNPLSSSVTDENMMYHHRISSSQGYYSRSITSPPGYQNDATKGLRMASLDGVDFDKSDHLGVPLTRVTTTPAPVPRLPPAQTSGRSAKKLSKMGISVADQAGRGVIPPPAHGIKFNFRSIFKSNKS